MALTAAPSNWVLTQPSIYGSHVAYLPTKASRSPFLGMWSRESDPGPSQALMQAWPLQSGGYDLNLFTSLPDCNFLCSVCHGVFKRPVRLPCSHIFCKKCILRWLARCYWALKKLGGQGRAGGAIPRSQNREEGQPSTGSWWPLGSAVKSPGMLIYELGPCGICTPASELSAPYKALLCLLQLERKKGRQGRHVAATSTPNNHPTHVS